MNTPPIYLQDLDLTISETFDEDALFSSVLGNETQPSVLNVMCRSYHTKPHIIAGAICYLRLYYQAGQLQSVHLFPGADKPPKQCHEATMEMLQEEKTECDAWLKRYLAESTQPYFDTSRVVAELDKKSWSASVIFSYRK